MDDASFKKKLDDKYKDSDLVVHHDIPYEMIKVVKV
jgi:hypothetical protein